jgi:hypothetical protein
VLEGLPALGEQGEAAFSQAADGTDQCVPSPGVDVEFQRPGRLLQGCMDAVACGLDAGRVHRLLTRFIDSRAARDVEFC